METFETYRPLLFSIAYLMLGSVMEAEDMVQESFIRWQSADTSTVTNPKAYLSSIVTRLCLDKLKSAQTQREQYIGEWLPEPYLVSNDTPSEMSELADSLSIAFLHMLERLSPVERAILLLRDVFAYEYSEIATIVDKSEAACRQALRRARQHVAADRPRFDTSQDEQAMLLMQFNQACLTGNMEQLLTTLADDIVSYSDGGGKVNAARKPIIGSDKVARFLFGLMKLQTDSMTTQFSMANNMPALIIYENGSPYAVMFYHIEGGKIQRIYNVVNPDKLAHLPKM